MKVLWTSGAVEDLQEAVDYLERSSFDAAARFAEAVLAEPRDFKICRSEEENESQTKATKQTFFPGLTSFSTKSPAVTSELTASCIHPEIENSDRETSPKRVPPFFRNTASHFLSLPYTAPLTHPVQLS